MIDVYDLQINIKEYRFYSGPEPAALQGNNLVELKPRVTVSAISYPRIKFPTSKIRGMSYPK